MQAGGVAGDRPERPLDARPHLDALGEGDAAHGVERAVHDSRDVHDADLEAELAGHDPRDVEEIVDQLRLHPGVANDDVEGAPRLLGGKIVGAQHAAPAEHRGERRSQLVRDNRQELVLCAIGRLGRGAGHPLAAQEVLPRALGELRVRHVGHDAHGALGATVGIPDGVDPHA